MWAVRKRCSRPHLTGPHWYFRPVPLEGHEDGFNRTAFGAGECAPLNIIARDVWLYETEVRQLKADRTLADCHD
jgi:hypothetical protein